MGSQKSGSSNRFIPTGRLVAETDEEEGRRNEEGRER